jgi:Eco29kI restriction endonuclease
VELLKLVEQLVLRVHSGLHLLTLSKDLIKPSQMLKLLRFALGKWVCLNLSQLNENQHDPGRGRYEQARSDWDVIHPGRIWAERCNGVPKAESVITANIDRHLQNIEGQL